MFAMPEGYGQSRSRIKVELADPDRGDLHLFKVKPGTYFPSYTAVAGAGYAKQITPVRGKVPVYEIEAGKINYIGRYEGLFPGNPDWRPEGLENTLKAEGAILPAGRFSVRRPKVGVNNCNGPKKGFKILILRCTLELTDESYGTAKN